MKILKYLLSIFSYFALLSLSAQTNGVTLTSTNIPLILINTNGQVIFDEPKINVNLKIIDNGPGKLNHPTDVPNVYNGHAGIEIRGNYSASLPQKPFNIETRNAAGENNNVSLLGMPAENDWVLLANYNDKVFLRNIVANDIFTKMGHYAPRTQLCEVIINNNYNGIYVFSEKIKRDSSRVDIAKLNPDENTGDDLTGGYIFKIDYWNSNDSWLSSYKNPIYPSNNVRFVYDYPDISDISSIQKNYIQSEVRNFENVLWGANFKDPVNGYRKYIDVRSFIDYFIVSEVSRNVDGYKKSRHFYKDKDSKNPLIFAGPVWDFDWAFKNHIFTNGEGWMYNFAGGVDVTPPGWYIRLLQDPYFADQLATRYFELRSTFLDIGNLNHFIDSLGTLVEDAQVRHYTKWDILGINVGTPEIGSQPINYAGELQKFKTWIAERLEWLDANMPGTPVDVQEIDKENPYISIYPNPSLEQINIYSETPLAKIEIFSMNGRLIRQFSRPVGPLVQINSSELKGLFLAVLTLENGQVINSKIVSY